jgi:hypothetical protein
MLFLCADTAHLLALKVIFRDLGYSHNDMCFFHVFNYAGNEESRTIILLSNTPISKFCN